MTRTLLLYCSLMRILTSLRTALAILIGTAAIVSVEGLNFFDLCYSAPLSPNDSSSRNIPTIVAFGNSLTAGLGVSPEESYPAQLQRRIDGAGIHFRVVNAGVSGDTTAGGIRRTAWVLKSKPRIVVLELGGNDGLRGLSLEETKNNLERIIQQFQKASATVVLAGMKLPPNYGSEYTKEFESIYQSLAKKYDLVFVSFFLEGVAGSSSLNQADGIHPTGDGYRIIADHIFETIRPLIEAKE